MRPVIKATKAIDGLKIRSRQSLEDVIDSKAEIINDIWSQDIRVNKHLPMELIPDNIENQIFQTLKSLIPLLLSLMKLQFLKNITII